MAESPDEPRARGAPTGTPRWVKVFGAITLLVLALFVIVLVTGGNHGPRRHAPGADTGGHTPPGGVTHAQQR